MAYLNVTGVDLKELAKAAYRFSRPQGLGYLHAKEGELSDEDAQQIVDLGKRYSGGGIDMDYVHGRACKFHVIRRGDQFFIRADWYDHGPRDLEALLAAIGKSGAAKVEDLPEYTTA